MNKVQLEGRLGKDPEIRFDKNGKPIGSVTLATSNDYKPKGSDEWVKKPASWHNLVAFSKDAEALGTYRKGDKLAVEGKITYDEWTDKEGKKRLTTKIVCFGIQAKDQQPEPHQDGPLPDDDPDNVPF